MAIRDVYQDSATALRIEVAARADRLAEIRNALRVWLRSLDAGDELIGDTLLAVDEACSNSIEHAYANRQEGVLTVSADLEADDVRVVVRDFGTWKEPAGDDLRRGRGMPVMRALTTRCDLRHGESGTEVLLVLPFRGRAAAG